MTELKVGGFAKVKSSIDKDLIESLGIDPERVYRITGEIIEKKEDGTPYSSFSLHGVGGGKPIYSDYLEAIDDE